MTQKPRKPAWFVLHALIALMVVALVLIGRDGFPAWANEIAGIGIVLTVFGAMALWVQVNMPALMDAEMNGAGLEGLRIQVYQPGSFSRYSQDENIGPDSIHYPEFNQMN